MDDMVVFMEYMQREIDSFKSMGQNLEREMVSAGDSREPHMTRNE